MAALSEAVIVAGGAGITVLSWQKEAFRKLRVIMIIGLLTLLIYN
jgi:hypothetical protein